MQLHFTLTRRELRAQFAALARTRGSLGARLAMTARLAVALSFALMLGVCALGLLSSVGPSPAALLTLALIAALLAAVAALHWALAPGLYASLELLTRRKAFGSLTEAPYTLRLENGRLHCEGPAAPAGRTVIDCAAADLRAVRRDKAGLVIVLADGSGLLAPNSAFADAQALQAWLQALQTASAAPAPDAAAPAPAASTVPEGFVPDGAGGGTAAFTLDAQTVAVLLREVNRKLFFTPAYWRRFWWAPVLIVLCCAYWIAEGMWWALPIFALVVVWIARRNTRVIAARAAGRRVTRFGPDAMHIETDGGAQFDTDYRGLLGPWRTEHALFVYHPGVNGTYLFPRAGLTPESEAALWALLCQKTGQS